MEGPTDAGGGVRVKVPAGLYGMVDAGTGERAAGVVDRVRFLADLGVEAVQLRAKAWESAALQELAAACQPHAPLFIINDHVRIAAQLGAWVHLGQDDGPDPAIPFGRSTHTLEQAAHPGDAAYIGFGPVFPTDTKDTGYTARGLEMLASAVRISPVPVIAIGGIRSENLNAVRATGVHGYAMVGGFWQHRDDPTVLAHLLGRSR